MVNILFDFLKWFCLWNQQLQFWWKLGIFPENVSMCQETFGKLQIVSCA